MKKPPEAEKKLIYLDHGATTPLHPAVLEAMLPYFSMNFGNPSSIHSLGIKSREAIENSRAIVARYLGAKSNEIVFTGSGTESDNMAILGVAYKLRKYGNHVITSNIEHPAVRNAFKKLEVDGYEVTYIQADANGIVHVEDVAKAIRPTTILISIMYVNNEIGTIQPITEIGELAAQKEIIFHTDAVQAVGKLPIDLHKLKVDLLSAAGHKFYGPKGVGILFYRNAGQHPKFTRYIQPIVFGGGQEFSMRPATENIPNIVGFGKALELAYQNIPKESERLQALRDDFIKWATSTIPDCFLNGHPTQRLYNNINLRFKGIVGEELQLRLDAAGIEVSTGSACSSKSHDGSYVVRAISGSTDEAYGTIRITLGLSSTSENLAYVKSVLKREVSAIRNTSKPK